MCCIFTVNLDVKYEKIIANSSVIVGNGTKIKEMSFECHKFDKSSNKDPTANLNLRIKRENQHRFRYVISLYTVIKGILLLLLLCIFSLKFRFILRQDNFVGKYFERNNFSRN